ncbi:hypothetical protein [Vibrio sp. R78045]|uniref:hypothetical protein n=1 Tax=Vibrio sp. R78045 TaxID=3093868 RepID=UPI0036F1AD99
MFPKNHLNRVWIVLGALDALDSPTLVNITKATGLPKATVNDTLKKLVDGQVLGVTVEKKDTEYRITEWVELKPSVRHFYSQLTNEKPE